MNDTYNFSGFDGGLLSAGETPNDLLNRWLTQALSRMLPGIGGFIAPMATDAIAKYTGIKYDRSFNSPLYSDTTSFGTVLSMQRSQFAQALNSTLKDYNSERELEFHKMAARNLNSFEAWRAKEENRGKTLADYERFIETEALGTRRNVASLQSIAYSLLDPYDIKKASAYQGIMVSNIAGRGLATGDRQQVANALALSKELFKNYDSGKWGDLSLPESSAVAAALTKNINPLEGIDKSSNIKEAAAKFERRVQEYSKALAPLKDVFGKDMGQLLQALEQLGGQTLSSMSTERVGELSRRLVNAVALTGTSVGQISAISSAYGAAMSKMDVDGVVRQQATDLGIDAIIASSGITPRFMDKTRFADITAKSMLKATASKGAAAVNKAYVLWAEKNGKELTTATMAEFQKVIQNNDGTVNFAKMYAAAGVKGAPGLEQAYAVDQGNAYEKATRMGVGSRIAQENNYGELRVQAKLAMNNALNVRISSANIEEALKQVDQGKILTLDTKERDAYLRAQNPNYTAEQRRQILDAVGYIEHTRTNLKVAAVNRLKQKEYLENAAKVDARRAAVEKAVEATGGVATSIKNAIVDVAGKPDGITTENLSTALARSNLLSQLGDVDTQAVAKAGVLGLGAERLTALAPEVRESAIKNIMTAALNYDNSASAYSNKHYQAARTAFINAKNDAERQRAAENMYIARVVGSDNMDAYYGKATGKSFEDRRTALLQTLRTTGNWKDFLKASALSNSLKDNKEVSSKFETWAKASSKYKGAMTVDAFNEFAKENSGNEAIRMVAEDVHNKISKLQEPGAAGSDMLGAIAPVITQIFNGMFVDVKSIFTTLTQTGVVVQKDGTPPSTQEQSAPPGGGKK